VVDVRAIIDLDGNPLHMCVVSEVRIRTGQALCQCGGGISTIDGGEADDNIVPMLQNDNPWAEGAVIAAAMEHYQEA
jgi:inorganic pyrophosphatase